MTITHKDIKPCTECGDSGRSGYCINDHCQHDRKNCEDIACVGWHDFCELCKGSRYTIKDEEIDIVGVPEGFEYRPNIGKDSAWFINDAIIETKDNPEESKHWCKKLPYKTGQIEIVCEVCGGSNLETYYLDGDPHDMTHMHTRNCTVCNGNHTHQVQPDITVEQKDGQFKFIVKWRVV